MAADPHAGIGGFWDEIGALQFEFLAANGLRPESTLFDLGCGTLRGGRHFIRFLDAGNYTGVDISAKTIELGALLVQQEGLSEKHPRLIRRLPNEGFFDGAGKSDFILAQSVLSHLPDYLVAKCLAELEAVLHRHSVFFFTFHPDAVYRQVGFKAFRYPPAFFAASAAQLGLHLSFHDYDHPRGQRMASLRRA